MLLLWLFRMKTAEQAAWGGGGVVMGQRWAGKVEANRNFMGEIIQIKQFVNS